MYKRVHLNNDIHDIIVIISSIIIILLIILLICVGKHHIQEEVHPQVNLEKEIPHTKWSTILWYPHQKQLHKANKKLVKHHKTLPQIYHKHLQIINRHEFKISSANKPIYSQMTFKLSANTNTKQFFKIKSIKSIDKSQKSNLQITSTKKCGKYIYSKRIVNHKATIAKQNIHSNRYKIISKKHKGKTYPSYLQHGEFTKNILELEK